MSRKGLIGIVICLAVILAGLLTVVLVRQNKDDLQPATTQTTMDTTGDGAESTAPTAPSTTAPTEVSTVPTEATTVPVTVEVKPGVVGLYIPAEDGTKARKLVREFTCKRVAKQDIDCFEVLASQEEYVSGSSFSGMWKQAWETAGAEENSKIGFVIELVLTDGQIIKQTILKPSDAKWFYDYLEVYLYDDIHQNGGWYTHLEDENIKEETVISSIKLTSGSKIDQVGDITLTAFVYQGEDCFDENGAYIADVLYTVAIPG